MSRDPRHITYDHLIQFVEAKVTFMQKNNDRLKLEGSLSPWTATHNLECATTLLKLLKKFKKEPQGDLFKMFEQLR